MHFNFPTVNFLQVKTSLSLHWRYYKMDGLNGDFFHAKIYIFVSLFRAPIITINMEIRLQPLLCSPLKASSVKNHHLGFTEL